MTQRILFSLLWLALLTLPLPAAAQVTPAQGSTPPNDTQSISVGAVVYYDYTYQKSPTIKDAAGNDVHLSQFQVSRTYINITGNVSHVVSFRVTPDIVRDTNATDTVLNGNLVFRIKYGFAQFNLDSWTGDWKQSWVRMGIHQTPYVDWEENLYRYRFQGTVFAERVGSMSSSDGGVSFHTNLPNNYGEVHVGMYNGENYNRVDVNNVKAFEFRGTLRPFGRGSPTARGLRVTGFWTQDAPVNGGRRDRSLFETTYEHKYFSAGYTYLSQNDQTLPAGCAVASQCANVNQAGWSIWATPFLKEKGNGFEGLLRYDDYTNNGASIPGVVTTVIERKETIIGIAYWFPHIGGNATTAVLLDYDGLTMTNQAKLTKIAVHGVINF